MTEWRAALASAWLILGSFGAAAVTVPFLVPMNVLESVVPRAAPHHTCALCGMTHAFYEIAAGNLAAARRHNRGAVPLFAALLINGCGLLAMVSRRRFTGGLHP
ncbi:MAG TPA: DUF2752 domain-containing protein [Thermoanaerobaculia bacterium]|nr:DUF2752 domain-containing protein [Thermoanaerobaculia bacterium]